MSQRSFTLLHGTHIHDGKKYTRGSVIVTDQPLTELFINKFEETREVVRRQPAKEVKEVADESVPTKKHPFGKDVTANYEMAQEAGLRVFVKSGAYNIVDEDAEDTALNGPSPLEKAEVKPFIKKYLKK
jgi:hypothetical protein